MEIISRISEMIEEETADVEMYARCAAKVKRDYPELADTFYRISEEEHNHANMLHAQVTHLIEKYRAEHGEPPEKMLFIYDYLHKKQIDAMARAMEYQRVYKEM